MKQPCIDMPASKHMERCACVASGLIKRVWEHKQDFIEGFTKQYGVHDLVW